MKHSRSRSRVNPVARAVALAGCRATLRDISLKGHFTDDGAVARELLAEYTFLIGLGAEVSIVADDDLARTRRLHSALRTVIGMSVNGGKWQAGLASRLHELASEAVDLIFKRSDIAMPRFPGARELAARVEKGVATMDDVAGAEIYQQEKT